MTLYTHQTTGMKFLAAHSSAMLCDEMGLGKTRQALIAGQQLYKAGKIDRIIVLCPAAVRYSWREELLKLEESGFLFIPGSYNPKTLSAHCDSTGLKDAIRIPVLLVSYSLLPQERHVKALSQWCASGKTLLVCDESSFLKNRTAKQTRGSMQLGQCSTHRWLLTGTPVANSPLDLFAQGLVMFSGLNNALHGFKNWYHFRARYGVMGGFKGKQVVAFQNVEELTKRFSPYVLRREKKDCLDLPEKTYEVREVALKPETWKVYCELKREALLCLPDSTERPEPNAAVRLLRLCQLTSGHVGGNTCTGMDDGGIICNEIGANTQDVSSEKLDWLAQEILDGELASERALIVWCRWRRERERLFELLQKNGGRSICEVYGGQSQKEREFALQMFSIAQQKIVLLAQPHAGGFGLNLTAASTAVYLSNDFSYTTRIQSEDRTHRIGQNNPTTYIDVLATGPVGQRTVDHHVLEALREKRSLAEWTCSQWRKVLE